MTHKEKEMKKRIEKATDILILTHKSPDVDAFCSSLLLKQGLEQIYPKKNFVLQTRQGATLKLPGTKEIEMSKKLDSTGFDLLIVTDAGDLSLCVTEEDNVSREIPTIYIDHHDTFFEYENNELLINNNMSSATEQVYVLLKEIWGRNFKLNSDMAELIQYGIVADTGRFLYDITTPNSHRVFAEALEITTVDLEDFAYRNSKFPREATPAIIKYLESLTIEKDMAYMFIDRDTLENNHELKQGASTAQSFLRDKYLRFIQGVHWGFVIKPDMSIEDSWFVSFRSTKGYQDVKVIAEELGGGGHTYSAGVQMKANSLNEVLNRILTITRRHLEREK